MLNKIKQYRLAAGLKPSDISDLFKIPYKTIEAWEKGTSVPPLWAEQKILDYLEKNFLRHKKR